MNPVHVSRAWQRLTQEMAGGNGEGRRQPAAGPLPYGEVGAPSHHTPLTFCPDGHQLHAFAGYVIQGFVDISNFVESHFSSVRFGQPFPCRGKRESCRHRKEPLDAESRWQNSEYTPSLNKNHSLTVPCVSVVSVNYSTFKMKWTRAEAVLWSPYAFQTGWDSLVWSMNQCLNK